MGNKSMSGNREKKKKKADAKVKASSSSVVGKTVVMQAETITKKIKDL